MQSDFDIVVHEWL